MPMKFKIIHLRYLFQVAVIGILIYLALGYGERTFEAYCPFGGVEALYGLFTTHNYTCALAETNLAMFIGLVVLVVISKKSFCGWICPIGAVSEVLNRIGFKIRKRRHYVKGRLDLFLRLLRYPVLILILYFTYKIGDLIFRGYDPFYLVFSGFGHGSLGTLSIILMSGILVASVFIAMPFCRYFCPLGAVQDLLAWAGVTKIHRNAANCTECGLCNEVCPQLIEVSERKRINHVDCTNCLECTEACPEENCLEVKVL